MDDAQTREALAGTGAEIGAAEVRDALASALASETFRSAAQLASFLSYVVNATLDGRAREIKGYTIAIEAFGREESFDPQVDPIVRVEAMRLRKAIAAYYDGEGADDPVRITVPRGGYIPSFERRQGSGEQVGVGEPAGADAPARPRPAPAPAPQAVAAAPADGNRHAMPAPARRQPPAAFLWRRQAPRGPALAGIIAGGLLLGLAAVAGLVCIANFQQLQPQPVAAAQGLPVDAGAARMAATSSLPQVEVAPFEASGALPAWFSAPRLRGSLVDALARFDDIVTLEQDRPADDGADRRGPPRQRYRLAIALDASDGRVDVSARLVHLASGEIVWSGDALASDMARPAAEADIARSFATMIAQPYGTIHADLKARRHIAGGLACLIETYDYRRDPTPAMHATVRDCLETTVGAEPGFAVAWANLALVYLDEELANFNPRPGSARERAQLAARKAVELHPHSARAQQALMAAFLLGGDVEHGLVAGRRAMALNPFDPDVLADVGARYVALGRVGEGSPMLERAYAANPARPPWYDFYLFLAAHLNGEAAKARQHAARLAATDEPLGLVAFTIASLDNADERGASKAMARLAALVPDPADAARSMLVRRAFAPAVVDRLVQDLNRARRDDNRW